MKKIRISASGFGRIELGNKFLVSLNKRRMKYGVICFGPFGGALKFYEPAREFLESLDVKYEAGNDLRLFMPIENLPAFEEWFYKKENRETGPYRELREELVEEEKALPKLSRDTVGLEYLATHSPRDMSTRPGSRGWITQRFYEIFDVNFSPSDEGILMASLKKPGTSLRLVTPEEILEGGSDDGIEIASACKYFLT